MNRTSSIFCTLLLFPFFCNSMNVSVSTASFLNGDKSYIEIYNRVSGESVQWVSDTTEVNAITANVEYLILISQQNKIIAAEKYNLTSPNTSQQMDFWDMKRIGLDAGKYELKLQYVDVNNPIDTFTFETEIQTSSNNNELAHSDILFMSKVSELDSDLPFQKNNFKFEPLAYNLIGTDNDQLIFYTELYNANETFVDDYFIKYYIENTDKTGFDAYSKTGYKKINPKSFEPLLINFDVAKMKSGNYKLHVELNKKDKSVLKSFSERFSIYNPLADYNQTFDGDAAFETSFVQVFDEEELNYSLKAIFPRLGNNMTDLANQIIRSDELEPKKYFLYNFWSSFSSSEVKSIYEKYMDVAKAVDLTYANNVGHGFETHRGYYFLKYGKPDDIIFVEDEPTAPPYEIWIFNYLAETQQTNVRFLFYNPSLATNDFILLHSTCRGERQNPRWELELYSGAYNDLPNNFIDSRSMPDGFNRNARKIFNDF